MFLISISPNLTLQRQIFVRPRSRATALSVRVSLCICVSSIGFSGSRMSCLVAWDSIRLLSRIRLGLQHDVTPSIDFLVIRPGKEPLTNALRGFGAVQWDFAVHREFHVYGKESVKLQFRAEMFNVLNHPNSVPPSGVFLDDVPSGFGLASHMLGRSLNGG